jgi:alpha-L-arabinofuranosidase
MFTANFGTGTVEEAADWVKYTNVTKKANVIYWEIGNEIYGDWHAQYAKYGADKGHTYGKRAKEFIVAMKKIDPKIKVGVIGVLDGEWNENVLKYTADVADALIIHHYPQHFGEENDFGLLASPQDLEKIFGRVRESIKKHSPKKELEIWLTEWNSVDFNPGPQSISLINGLFVADYLGMLAKVGAGSAQYWDIHNDITPEGGDYGYLSRSYEEIIGGNKPRPSYYAFQMASDGIRGKLVESSSGNTDLTTYLSVNGKKKTLLAINKNPYTAFNSTIKIPGFAGKAKVEVLAAPKGQVAGKVVKIEPPKASNQEIKEGGALTFPAHSITLITIE